MHALIFILCVLGFTLPVPYHALVFTDMVPEYYEWDQAWLATNVVTLTLAFYLHPNTELESEGHDPAARTWPLGGRPNPHSHIPFALRCLYGAVIALGLLWGVASGVWNAPYEPGIGLALGAAAIWVSHDGHLVWKHDYL